METVALQQNLHHQHQAHHRGAVQPENWLYEIKQKGQDSTNTCYVMVQNVRDLVKSHLMFAVREEVEVLKEKISELMDRINQLEYENNILKQNASQETLSQLTTGGGSNTSTTAAAAAVVAAAAAAAAATAAAAAAASASAPSAAVPASKGPTSAAANPSSNGSVS